MNDAAGRPAEGVWRDLDTVVAAVEGAGTPPAKPAGTSPADEATLSADRSEDLVQALEALRRLRESLQDWEPTLIEAARAAGASWSRLAPALGVTTRQAAERRYLRLRPSSVSGMTGEQRVRATRDARAGDRAVAGWARENAAQLRQVAGQVAALAGLSSTGRRRASALRSSLSEDDPAALLQPLGEMHRHIAAEHGGLAAQVDAINRAVSVVRDETQENRRRPGEA